MTMNDIRARVVLTVAIIGGGLTGAAVALHLRQTWAGHPDALDIRVFEPRAEIGRGLAYDTAEPSHRVNVPVNRMSIDPADEAAFETSFFQSGQDRADPAPLGPDGRYYPRREAFGRYVHEALKPHLAAGAIRHVAERVETVSFERGHYILTTTGGSRHLADILVVATSHPPPSLPVALAPLAGDGRLVADPTRADALAGIGPEDRVLVVGSGLTAADVIASLDDRGYRGKLTVFSRRGLRSRGHAAVTLEPVGDFTADPPKTALALLRRVRREVADAAARGIPWQAVFDALRAQGGQIWRALDAAERRRFLRHLRTYWDVHRFRIAPQVKAVADRLVDEGRLRFLAASLAGVDYAGPQAPISITLRNRRDGRIEEADFDAVIVTTGPAHGSVIAQQPYLQNLNGLGLVMLDETGLGIACDTNARALDLWGASVPGLYIAGPLARGTFGELMGLPQVNEQALLVAGEIRRELEKRLSWLSVPSDPRAGSARPPG